MNTQSPALNPSMLLDGMMQTHISIPDDDYAKMRDQIIEEYEKSGRKYFTTVFEGDNYFMNLSGVIEQRWFDSLGDGYFTPRESWPEYSIHIDWYECLDEEDEPIDSDFDATVV